jgi:MFS family permease
MCSAAAKQPGVSPAVAIAAVSTTGYLGFLVGPPLIGLIANTQTLRIALLLVVILSGAAAMLAAAARPAGGARAQDIKDVVRPVRHT